MKKRYEKYCPGCGKTYKSDTPEFEGTVLEDTETGLTKEYNKEYQKAAKSAYMNKKYSTSTINTEKDDGFKLKVTSSIDRATGEPVLNDDNKLVKEITEADRVGDYKQSVSDALLDAIEHQRQVNEKQHTINEMLIDSVESLIVAEIDSNTIKHYEQGVADAEANEEPRPFKQMQGKKWTSEKEYMNDYVPPTDIKDIGKE